MYPINHHYSLTVALPLLLSAQVSFAETPLDNIVVTANRVAKTVNETLVPVTIISRADIEKYQANDIIEVLRHVPGLNITNSGGAGKASSIFIRGTNSGHVLVLIDGVKHGSATLGTTAFEHLPLDQIERIEIVRGSRSSLYGSEAIGGVIQLFTRKGGQGFKPSFTIGMGSHDTKKANVNFAGGNLTTWYNLGLSTIRTEGIDACNSTTAGCFADEPDNDGYDRKSISVRTGHQFNQRLKGELSALRAKGHSEYDGGSQNEADFIQQSLSASLSADMTRHTQLTLKVGQSRDDSDNLLNGNFSSSFNTKRHTASALTNIDISDNNSVLVGIDWQNDQVKSTVNYAIKSRKNKGIFLSYTGQLPVADIEVSLRKDNNEQFGHHTTGSLSLGHDFNNGLRLTASHGTAFKAPSFNQLYWPSFGTPSLKPEESRYSEIGLRQNRLKGSWEVNVFNNQIDNLISGFIPNNIAKAGIKGIEGSVTTKIVGWDLSTNLTLQDPKILSDANNGKTLVNRPKKILNIAIDHRLGRWNFGTSIHAESKRFANANNMNELSGFATLGLRAEYKINKSWSVGVKANNLLDKEYELNRGFNQDGVNGMLTVHYKPKSI